MSNSDDEELVGYGRPPRRHRFSRENQPRRRGHGIKTKAADSYNLNGYILDALSEKVGISQNGKTSTAMVMAAFAKKLVNDTVNGSADVKMRFLDYLRRSGLISIMELKNQLEEEVEARVEAAEHSCSEAVGCLQMAVELIQELRARIIAAADSYLIVCKECSCGAFEKYPETASTLEKWREEPLYSDEEAAANETEEAGVDASHTPPSVSPEGTETKIWPEIGRNSHDTDDDFYNGMIGNG